MANPQQPYLVKDITVGSSGEGPLSLTVINDTLYFSNGQLWKSDGIEAGTISITSLGLPRSTSRNKYLAAINGNLYFTAVDSRPDGQAGILFKSDGTANGTVEIRDSSFSTNDRWINPRNYTDINGSTFFNVDYQNRAPGSGFKLVNALAKTDGTVAGTVLVKTFTDSGLGVENLTDVNGIAYFTVGGQEGLWKSDGSTAGTVLVKNLSASNLTNVNGTLFFSANDGSTGEELWKSDGTEAGTVLVKDINTANGVGSIVSPSTGKFGVLGNTIFFAANDGARGTELWKSDGTNAGTVLVKDIAGDTSAAVNGLIRVISGSSNPDEFTNLNGTIYFKTSSAINTYRPDNPFAPRSHETKVEIWKTDGTSTGTTLVKTIATSPGGTTNPVNNLSSLGTISLTNVNGTLFFSADSGATGSEVWTSDGTSTGTNLLRDINKVEVPNSINPSRNEGSNPSNFTYANGKAFFTADDGINGRELWAVDLNSNPAPAPNQAPIVANAIANQTTTIGTTFNFAIPTNAFSDSDAGNTLTYAATLADGNNLPTWLTFNATTQTFTGTPPTGTGNLNLRVKATDNGGLSVTEDFALTIGSSTTPPLTGIQRISVSPSGAQANGGSLTPSFGVAFNNISGDGRYVLYASDASNLVSDDTNNEKDLFIYDRTTNTNTKIGVLPEFSFANMSRNGRYVVYGKPASSGSGNLAVYNVVDRTSTDLPSSLGTISSKSSISDDGRYVVLYTGGGVTLVDRNNNNSATPLPEVLEHSDDPAIAPDGSFILYTQTDFSNANNPANGTYRYNVAAGKSAKISDQKIVGFISSDGRYVTYLDSTNAAKKIDLTTNVVTDGNPELAPQNTFGSPIRQISEDGQFRLIFANDAASLVPSDNNGFIDAFLAPLTNGGTGSTSGNTGGGSTTIPGLTLASNLFQTDATFKGFGITPVSQKASQKVSEIALFAVDDLTGKIGSLSPGQSGYLSAVLDLAKPVLSTLANSFFSTSNREISLDPNKIYQALEIVDGSILEAKQQLAAGKTPTNLLFSLPDASGNSPIEITSNNNGYQISINDDQLVLDVVKLTGAGANIPIGAKSQSAPEGRTIDLTDYVGQTLKADLVTNSSAAYNNNIGFYAVEDSIGSIKLANGSSLKPGDANYAVEAIKLALTNSLQAGKTDSQMDLNIAGGKIYAPVVIAQGTLNDFITKNPTNGGGANDIHAYFNYIGANSDKVDHFRLLGNNTFGVEDIYGGGDRDFNDVVIKMDLKV